MAAHSYVGPRRYWNLPSYGGYCRGVERGGAAGARAGERVLSPRERLEEALFTALRRRNGVALPEFARRYGVDVLKEYARALADAFEAGLIEVAEERLRLTRDGMLLSNEVFKAFV
jgi:oxygen-independent coproporphyrinogen-3 oxidase